ncbi:CheR family methyltransferase [Labilibacter marinus]|uniref:CheR family methyltransferase n=1 Tax=Labilibacter marinus TaxID=1477105 RepID=UPI000831D486|nr:CheR family methyltransferase [Labilibacter marinus]
MAGPTINDIREVTALLSKKLGMDYSNYAFSFLRRRFAFVYNKLKVKNTADFITAINDGKILEDFNYYFPVGQTELFRDPSFWRNLRTRILPKLSDEELVFWFPEVSSSAELFSLLVILNEEELINKSKVYCNINSEKRIQEIKEGKIYSNNIDINKQNFKRLELDASYDKYFKEDRDFTFIYVDLLKNVEIIGEHYFKKVPVDKIGMTIFRNKMLYYNQKLQLNAERHIHSSIERGSFLSLGIKERILDENENYYDLYDNGEQIYKVS